MPASSLSPWEAFKAKWRNCSQCELCNVRRNIVLAKGKIPCDVLFVGEAPGQSEDVLGIPFVGPAGHLLDSQIREALENSGKTELRLAYTNLVCCIPKEGGQKVGEPPKESIQSCEPRLVEFMSICKPRLVVCVGDLAEKYLPDFETTGGSRFRQNFVMVSITHPAAILRAEIVRKPLMEQKVIVTLECAFRDLV